MSTLRGVIYPNNILPCHICKTTLLATRNVQVRPITLERATIPKGKL